VRVLHLCAGNLYGGVESILVTLARDRHLCPEMEASFALCFAGRLSDELTACDAPVHRLGAARVSRPWTVWRARRRLDALLARERFDAAVVQECWPHALFAPVLRRRGIPTVFFAQDTHAGTHWLERWARRTRPALVLANSRWTHSHLRNLFPGVPSAVVYPPAADRTPEDRAAVRRAVRAELGTADADVVIVQASRLERWKGHALLLQALEPLVGRPGWQCWIAGGAQRPHEETYLAELRAQVAATGLSARVRFLGQRTDVPCLLAAADIHCQPNTGPEPFGIAFVEALYAGLPVVTTALGGPLEIIDESCGRLVPPADAARLTAALAGLLSDAGLRARLGEGGPDRARKLCDPAGQLARLHGQLATQATARVCHAF
jgi:glycosyltransferase involved in cell wall biosynthesis